MMRSIFILSASLFAMSQPSHAQGALNFASDVSTEQKTLISQDLALLKTLDLSLATQKDALSDLFETNSPSGEALHDWFHKRVQWIVSDMNRYPLMAIQPEDQTYRSYRYRKLENWMVSQIGGINFGAVLYDLGDELTSKLKTQTQIKMRIDQTWVDISSPRAGIILVGKGLLNPETSGNTNPNEFSARIFRLGVLLHEARHSDGNAESLGFGHVICPRDAGSELAGAYNCDASNNGSHRISAEFFRAVLESCGNRCTQRDRSLLTTHYKNAMARIPTSARNKRWDPTPAEPFEAVDASSFERLGPSETLLDF
jgi:hypothetical protein